MKSPYTFKHIAPTTNHEKTQPAIFLFHGLGSNEDDLIQLVEPFKGGCHIFSLRGPITHSPGYAFYTFEEEGKPTRSVFDQMIMFTQSFIKEAIEHYHLDANKIYLLGFNQGAVVAQALTISLGQLIRGAAILSGFLPDFVREEYRVMPLNDTKVFISHGEFDYVYPIPWGEAARDFFIDQGAKVTFKTYPDGHGVTPENLGDLIKFLSEDLQLNVH